MNTLPEGTPTTADLISQAQQYVRRGGTIRVDMSSYQAGPHPVAIMSLTEEMLWFLFAGDDHPHGNTVDWIKAGDDGQVLVSGDKGEKLVTIWGTWTTVQADTLEWWLEGSRKRLLPHLLGVGPEPPDIVQYEGLLEQDTWRRYRGTPGRSCTIRLVEVDAVEAHGIIEQVELEIGPDQAVLSFPPDSVPDDWQPLQQGTAWWRTCIVTRASSAAGRSCGSTSVRRARAAI
jgi:hypothetical protein